jgi:S-formylglutathione hydrolase
MTIRLLSENRCQGGWWQRYRHSSNILQCEMTFSVYRVEPQADTARPTEARPSVARPNAALLWLSGLTCTDQNFVQKAHAEKTANELGLTLLVPDTSPRDIDFPGVADSWDLGLGAGFYLDATQEPWQRHFRMVTTHPPQHKAARTVPSVWQQAGCSPCSPWSVGSSKSGSKPWRNVRFGNSRRLSA